MSESVTIVTEPLAITVFDDTPIVTIVDANTGEITVTDGTPSVTVSRDQPTQVIVNTGGGGPYAYAELEGILADQVTIDFLDPTLTADVDHLRDLWTRYMNGLLLTYQDGVDIQTAYTLYTDTRISSTVLDLEVANGAISLLRSDLVQEAGRIDASVLSLEGDVSGRFVAAEGRLTITESQINSTVSRLTSLDGPGGQVELLQSGIDQRAGEISLAVERIIQNEDDIATTRSELSLTEDAITAVVNSHSTLNSNFSEARIELTATSAQTSVQQISIDGHSTSLTAVETMLANKWGVNITEDGNGVAYTTGISLVLHQDWASTQIYEFGDYVYFYDAGVGVVYRCLADHTSDGNNSPTGTLGVTHWVADPDGKKTEFIIKADQFQLYGSTGAFPLLTVNEDEFTLASNIKLTASVLESVGFGTAYRGYRLDPVYGIAEFHNMKMVITSWDEFISGDDLPEAGATKGMTLIEQNNYANLVTTVNDLQGQLDGVLEQWFDDGRPVVDIANYAWAAGTYALGAIVEHNGSYYVSDIADNTSEPGVANWTIDADAFNLSPYADWVYAAYAAGTTYGLGDIVLYGGTHWTSLQADNLGNTPAENAYYWTGNSTALFDLRSTHLSDLYYDNNSGLGYRFQYVDPDFLWVDVNSAVAAALAAAAAAQITADGKRRVFIDDPTDDPPQYPDPPYDAGDLWDDQSTPRKLLICTTARTALQSYTAGDFTDLANYITDISQLGDTELLLIPTWSGIRNDGGKPADGSTKNFVYFQTEPPDNVDLVSGDIWVDIDDYQIYTYDGAGWVPGKSGKDSILIQLEIPEGVFFKNNTGAVKNVKANVHIGGVKQDDTAHLGYHYRWLSSGYLAYVDSGGNYVGTNPGAGLYPADPDTAGGLNFRTILVDYSDVGFTSNLVLTCEVSNIPD